ncbi:hypothetical protein I6E17_05350 [Fusobacterium perfoetens]|uniref:DUF6672 family protein n=1 Tax=Fusobacterium perfoetens TaxID=852 RepID=UPI001F3017D7|nr:DUF6672 family protein [Fusobacterium perfoetens]MCF2625606.1 hypothetical protein [Fusobacterium perfoetens]
MKRILSWVVVMAAVIVLSVILFVTGKQHKVMLINGENGAEVPARVAYIVDGQNADKPKSIRANKKGVVYVKGINHKITIRFKDANGQNQEITKNFKTKLSQEEIIDFAGIISGAENWIIYKDSEAETAEEE